jgi:thioredoxin 1
MNLIRKILPWLFIIFLSALLIVGFAMKDNMNSYLSKMMITQAGSDVERSGSAYVDSLFNYAENGIPYRFTFLEFGAKGCSGCKRMEGVMEEIRQKFPQEINVVFFDVTKPANQFLIKYFGIASIPTQVFLNNNGREIFRHSGVYSSGEIAKKLLNPE